MSEDDLRRAVADPNCPFTYEELWDLIFGPRGRPLLEIIEEYEQDLDRGSPGAAE